MTAERFRRLALSMQGAIESAHMGHPDFRANGRIFATLHSNGSLGMVKLTPAEQRAFMRDHPAMFAPSSGAWGRQGCTNVRLSAADESAVRGAMILAWESVVATPRSRRTAAPAARKTSRPSRNR